MSKPDPWADREVLVQAYPRDQIPRGFEFFVQLLDHNEWAVAVEQLMRALIRTETHLPRSVFEVVVRHAEHSVLSDAGLTERFRLFGPRPD